MLVLAACTKVGNGALMTICSGASSENRPDFAAAGEATTSAAAKTPSRIHSRLNIEAPPSAADRTPAPT